MLRQTTLPTPSWMSHQSTSFSRKHLRPPRKLLRLQPRITWTQPSYHLTLAMRTPSPTKNHSRVSLIPKALNPMTMCWRNVNPSTRNTTLINTTTITHTRDPAPKIHIFWLQEVISGIQTPKVRAFCKLPCKKRAQSPRPPIFCWIRVRYKPEDL